MIAVSCLCIAEHDSFVSLVPVASIEDAQVFIETEPGEMSALCPPNETFTMIYQIIRLHDDGEGYDVLLPKDES